MHKLLYFPVLLVAACVVAATYGAAHNQISYTVSPEFFVEYQFYKFDIPPEMWNRTGATLIGILATWWMGLVIGLPTLLLGLMLPGWKAYVKHSLLAFGVVAGTALLVGLAALVRAHFESNSASARAGTMHDFSYIGGGVGLLAAVAYLIVVRVRIGRAGTANTPAR